MIIRTIRLSQTAKEQLVRLKQRTGIKTWNVLCRWALCVSLAEPSVPQNLDAQSDSNLEMDWKTFCGAYESAIKAIVLNRCSEDGLGIDPTTVAKQFKLHLHRGISYLAGNKKILKIDDLVEIVYENSIENSNVSIKS